MERLTISSSRAAVQNIEFHDENDTVMWRLDSGKALELSELLTGMSQHAGRGHHYVDMLTPARTLVISLEMYI